MTSQDIRPTVPFGGPQLVVLDTNWVFDDLIYQLRREREEGVLLRAARGGAVQLFAGSHVYEEVYRRAETQAHRVDPSALLELFERAYLPLVRFVELPDELSDPRAERVAAEDLDDVPTAELALLLAPCVVFTRDRDLRDAGFGSGEWLPVARAAERIVKLDWMAWGTLELTRGGWRRSRDWARKGFRDLKPIELLAGVGLGLGILSVMSPSAYAAVSRALGVSERFVGGVAQMAAALALEALVERGRQGVTLHAASVPPHPKPKLEQRAARYLALHSSASVAELMQAVRVRREELEMMLQSHPAFTFESGQWQLGSFATRCS